jgi:hypothetical protein
MPHRYRTALLAGSWHGAGSIRIQMDSVCCLPEAAGLDTARVSAGARARLLHLARHGPGVAAMPDDGLFCGWAGVAVALRAWSRIAADAAAASAAAQVTSRIAGRIVQAPAGRPQ